MSTTQCSRTVTPAQKVGRKAFTLIELLVVIAIIAILAAILFPVFARARENARRTSCISNQKQIALGFIQYYQDYDERFPMSKGSGDGSNHWARGSLQPYLKSTQLLRCPNDNSSEFPGGANAHATTPRITSYALNGLLLTNTDIYNAANPATQRATYPLGSVIVEHLAGVQSPSTVILLAEAPDRNNHDRNYFHSFWWTSAANLGGCNAENGHTTTGSGTGVAGRFCTRVSDNRTVAEDIATERHMGGFNVAYLDGHVKWVKWEQVYKLNSTDYTPPLVGQFDPRNGA